MKRTRAKRAYSTTQACGVRGGRGVQSLPRQKTIPMNVLRKVCYALVQQSIFVAVWKLHSPKLWAFVIGE